MEDSLKRLDKLTQEEARMATAQVLKVTHIVDERVKGVVNQIVAVDDRVAIVDDRVAGIDDRVSGVDERVRTVNDKVTTVIEGVQSSVTHWSSWFNPYQPDGKEARVAIQQAANNTDQVQRLSFPRTSIRCAGSTIHAGNQLRWDIRRWLSPPDPSMNHNISCNAHHEGTATWFFEGSIFKEWRCTGSLLWVHGKRRFACRLPLNII